MLYFVKKGNRIEKYEVTYDKAEMEKLKYEIIENCSEIIHHSYDDTAGPDEDDYLRTRNLIKTKVGVREHNDFYDIAPETVYHFEYDEYEFPYLVSLIDMLRHNNAGAREMILNPDFSYEPESFEKRINDLMKKASRISNRKTKEKIAILEDLARLTNQSELNANQKSVKEYYPIVQKLINLRIIDSIQLTELEKIQSFFEIESIGNIPTCF